MYSCFHNLAVVFTTLTYNSNTILLGYDFQSAIRVSVNWSAQTTVALTLPLESGENSTWHVATPHSILQHFVSSVPNVESLFNHCLPGKPLQIILYHDECTPWLLFLKSAVWIGGMLSVQNLHGSPWPFCAAVSCDKFLVDYPTSLGDCSNHGMMAI